MPSLIIERGPERGQIIELPLGSRFVIGREEGSEILISDHACSRRHCGIIEQDGVVLLKDLNSTHGTTVNGKQVQKKRLKDGDVIGIGETLFSFMEESRDADLVGRVVGGYKIHGRVGRGGMGTVYRGHQVALDREVALKVLSCRYSEDTTFINRFFKEAQAAARLNHPNVVQVYDVREENGLYFISLEMMDQGTVQDLATEQGQLPISRVLEIARDAARGLMYAEKQKIVHGDIKPDNLMINSDGHIKISDLGLARDAGELSSQGEEGIFGTPHFIAPEQALGKRVDTRSDIYSLGATLYRLVSGQTPHDGSSVQEIVLKQINTTPTDICELRSDCPKDLRDLISVMMAKEPEERFENATDLLSALKLLGDNGRIKSPASVAVPLAIAVLVVVAGVGVWWLQKTNNGESDTPNANGRNTEVVENDPVDNAVKTAQEEEALAAQQRSLRAQGALVKANTRKLELKQEGKEKDVQALTELVALFEEVVAIAPNSEDATASTAEIEQIMASIRSIQASQANAAAAAEEAERVAEETYLTLQSNVEAAIAKDAFGSALAALIESRKKLVKTHREKDLRTLSNRIMQSARERSDNLHGSADRCMQSGDFDGARECIRKITQSFNPSRSRDGIFAELESLVKLAESQITTIDVKERAQTTQDLANDQTRCFEALKKLYTILKKALPSESAAKDLANVQASLNTPLYKAQLNPIIEDLLAVNALKGRLDAVLKTKDGPSVRLYGVRNLPTGKLIASDANSVTVELRNKSTKTVAWKDIDPETAIRQIFRRAAVTNADRITLLHMCLLLGHLEQAQKTLAEIKPDANATAELADLKQRIEMESRATKLLARIHELKKLAESNQMTWFEINDLAQSLLVTCRGTRALILESDGKTPLVANP